MSTELSWITDCSRRVMIGLHVPDYDQVPEYKDAAGLPPILSQIDPVEIVRQLKEAHVQMFWYYSKCHMGNAYYPSKVGHVHSALNGRDLFGEFTEACLSEGIIPGCVYEFSDRRLPIDKPEWCHKVIDEDLEEGVDLTDAIQGANVSGACLNGPYGDFVIDQTLEVLKNYPVKGYYIDFLGLFTFGRWFCPYCGKKFKKDFGFEFRGIKNLSHSDYVKYVKWHYHQNDLYAKKLRKAMKDIRPDVAFVHNFHGNSDKVNLQRPDFASENCDFVGGDLFQMRAGMLQMSWKLRQYGSLTREGPGEALLDTVSGVASDFHTPKALDSYRAELWTARSANVNLCSSIISSIPGRVQKETFELIEKVFEEQIPYDKYLRDMEPIATIGIFRSHNSYEFRPEQENTVIRHPHHCLEFEGWCQALIESHQLWDVISEHQLTVDYLKKFKVLVLPDACCMSRDQCEAIEQFVKEGGRLIATGETSLFDEDGGKLNNFRLSQAMGVKFKADRNLDFTQLKITGSGLVPDKPWKTDVLFFRDGQLTVETLPGAQSLGRIFKKTKITLCNAMIPTDHQSGLVSNNFGQGKIFYFAGNPGLQYRVFGQHFGKEVMSAVIEQCVVADTPVKLKAPDTVELFAHRQKGNSRLIVNLVNAVSGTSRSSGSMQWFGDRLGCDLMRFDETEEMPPAENVILRVKAKPGEIKRIASAPNNEELEYNEAGEWSVVKVPGFRVHNMIVIEFNLDYSRKA